jgi:hypothetical protein
VGKITNLDFAFSAIMFPSCSCSRCGFPPHIPVSQEVDMNQVPSGYPFSIASRAFTIPKDLIFKYLESL